MSVMVLRNPVQDFAPHMKPISFSSSSSSSKLFDEEYQKRGRTTTAKEMRTHFDHENLDVYQLELRFVAWVATLLANIKRRPTDARIAEVSDQLDRASLSSLLNTAEGNGRRQRRTRAKFFDDARGSVTESAACLDALVAKGICTTEEIQQGKEMLLRIASMLTKLISLFDSSATSSSSPLVREEPSGKEFEREEEDEDENA